MKVDIQMIINNPKPQLFTVKTINVKKDTFEYESYMVDMLKNKLNIDKMDSEFIYVIGLNFSLQPKVILLAGIGNNSKCTSNLRGIATGLLLSGSEQFYVFHNHPGKNKTPSKGDTYMTQKYDQLGDLIGIDFVKHIMVAGDYYTECEYE